MHHSTTPSRLPPTDFEVLMGEVLPLPPESYTRALAASDAMDTPEQWQVYLNELAQSAVTDWLHECLADVTVTALKVDQASATVTPVNEASETAALFWLQVNDFRWCVLVTESLIDGTVAIPTTLLNTPALAAHFYVVVEVFEAVQKVMIRGYLRYPQLLNAAPAGSPNAHECLLSQEVFTPSMVDLLRDVQLLDTATFGLPSLQPPSPLQGVPPKLAYMAQAKQAVINLAGWYQERLDKVTQDLGWSAPIPLQLAYGNGWRSADHFDAAISTMVDRGTHIPPEARYSRHAFLLDNEPLEILVTTWPLSSRSSSPDRPDSLAESGEWSLLAILGTLSGSLLPMGVELQISDQTQVLSQQQLDTEALYLMAHVVGAPNDQLDIDTTLGMRSQNLGSFIFMSEPENIIAEPSIN